MDRIKTNREERPESSRESSLSWKEILVMGLLGIASLGVMGEIFGVGGSKHSLKVDGVNYKVFEGRNGRNGGCRISRLVRDFAGHSHTREIYEDGSGNGLNESDPYDRHYRFSTRGGHQCIEELPISEEDGELFRRVLERHRELQRVGLYSSSFLNRNNVEITKGSIE